MSYLDNILWDSQNGATGGDMGLVQQSKIETQEAVAVEITPEKNWDVEGATLEQIGILIDDVHDRIKQRKIIAAEGDLIIEKLKFMVDTLYINQYKEQ